jgi:hypothetical protein
MASATSSRAETFTYRSPQWPPNAMRSVIRCVARRQRFHIRPPPIFTAPHDRHDVGHIFAARDRVTTSRGELDRFISSATRVRSMIVYPVIASSGDFAIVSVRPFGGLAASKALPIELECSGFGSPGHAVWRMFCFPSTPRGSSLRQCWPRPRSSHRATARDGLSRLGSPNQRTPRRRAGGSLSRRSGCVRSAATPRAHRSLSYPRWPRCSGYRHPSQDKIKLSF